MITINHPGWNNLKDTDELMVKIPDLSKVLSKAFSEAFIPAVKRASVVMNELGEVMYRVAEKEYLKQHKRLPGGTKSVRLRKKRRTIVIRWFFKNQYRR